MNPKQRKCVSYFTLWALVFLGLTVINACGKESRKPRFGLARRNTMNKTDKPGPSGTGTGTGTGTEADTLKPTGPTPSNPTSVNPDSGVSGGPTTDSVSPPDTPPDGRDGQGLSILEQDRILDKAKELSGETTPHQSLDKLPTDEFQLKKILVLHREGTQFVGLIHVEVVESEVLKGTPTLKNAQIFSSQSPIPVKKNLQMQIPMQVKVLNQSIETYNSEFSVQTRFEPVGITATKIDPPTNSPVAPLKDLITSGKYTYNGSSHMYKDSHHRRNISFSQNRSNQLIITIEEESEGESSYSIHTLVYAPLP